MNISWESERADIYILVLRPIPPDFSVLLPFRLFALWPPNHQICRNILIKYFSSQMWTTWTELVLSWRMFYFVPKYMFLILQGVPKNVTWCFVAVRIFSNVQRWKEQILRFFWPWQLFSKISFHYHSCNIFLKQKEKRGNRLSQLTLSRSFQLFY